MSPTGTSGPSILAGGGGDWTGEGITPSGWRSGAAVLPAGPSGSAVLPAGTGPVDSFGRSVELPGAVLYSWPCPEIATTAALK